MLVKNVKLSHYQLEFNLQESDYLHLNKYKYIYLYLHMKLSSDLWFKSRFQLNTKLGSSTQKGLVRIDYTPEKLDIKQISGNIKNPESGSIQNINISAEHGFEYEMFGILKNSMSSEYYGFSGDLIQGKLTVPNGKTLYNIPDMNSYFKAYVDYHEPLVLTGFYNQSITDENYEPDNRVFNLVMLGSNGYNPITNYEKVLKEEANKL